MNILLQRLATFLISESFWQGKKNTNSTFPLKWWKYLAGEKWLSRKNAEQYHMSDMTAAAGMLIFYPCDSHPFQPK